jgi:hypothetical protein
VKALLFAALLAALTPQQSRLVESARAAALQYSDWLPNLICTERVQRAIDWQGTGVWSRADDLTLEVTDSRRGESYKLLSRGGRPAALNTENLAGAVSKGEFGSALRWIFEPSAEASFEWIGRGRIRGQRVETFAYRVEAGNSRLQLRALTKAVVAGFHGRVSIDPATGRVLRLTVLSEGPADFPIEESYAEVDYDWAVIAGERYLVPVRAETRMNERLPPDPRGQQPARVTKYRNRMEFRDYREFKSESTLTFESSDPKKF